MSALEELIRQAMGSGFVCIAERAAKGEIDLNGPVTDALGDFPAEFIRIRTDLVDAVHVEMLEILAGDA